METKIEGILLRKTPYQDRHLMTSILLRSGEVISCLFYGGQGGGKRKKSSLLELGFMLKVELNINTQKHRELYRAKEWSLIWYHKKIRLNHKAFYILCLMIEMIAKLSPSGNLHEPGRPVGEKNIGTFRILSNALYYMEKKLLQEDMLPQRHLFLFLGKLLQEQGISPQQSKCCLCEENLTSLSRFILSPAHGGFVCTICLNREEIDLAFDAASGPAFLAVLNHVFHQKYSELTKNEYETPRDFNRILLHYLFYQYQLRPVNFKSFPLVF